MQKVKRTLSAYCICLNCVLHFPANFEGGSKHFLASEMLIYLFIYYAY